MTTCSKNTTFWKAQSVSYLPRTLDFVDATQTQHAVQFAPGESGLSQKYAFMCKTIYDFTQSLKKFAKMKYS